MPVGLSCGDDTTFLQFTSLYTPVCNVYLYAREYLDNGAPVHSAYLCDGIGDMPVVVSCRDDSTFLQFISLYIPVCNVYLCAGGYLDNGVPVHRAYLCDGVDDMLVVVSCGDDTEFLQFTQVLRDFTLHRLQRQPRENNQQRYIQ